MKQNMLFVKGALLLALVLITQSLRFVLPLPPFITIFIIGTLVNAFLLVAVLETDTKIASIICILAPLVAFMQGQLPLVPFIPVVIAGNLAYIFTVKMLQNRKQLLTALIAALAKTGMLFLGLKIVLEIVSLPETASVAMTTALTWPQLITASCGVFTGFALRKYLYPK